MCQKANFAEASFFAISLYVIRVRMDSDYSLNEQKKGNVFTAYQYIFSPLSLTGIVNESWTNNPDDAESG